MHVKKVSMFIVDKRVYVMSSCLFASTASKINLPEANRFSGLQTGKRKNTLYSSDFSVENPSIFKKETSTGYPIKRTLFRLQRYQNSTNDNSLQMNKGGKF